MSTPNMTSIDIPSEGKITFVAFRPKNQLPVTCRPLPDHTGKMFTGQGKHGYFETLTAEEKASLPFIFNYDTGIIIEDGKVLDLDDPYDAAVWVWLQKHPYIVVDKALAHNMRDAVFYVANAAKEAKERVDKTAKSDQARPAVRQLSETDRVRAAKALGLDGAEGLKPDQVLDWLLNKADSLPEAVLGIIEPANKSRVNATIAAGDFLKYGVIERLKDGGIYFGGEGGVNMGHSIEMVVDFLLDPKNVERVKGMKAMFAEKTKQPATTETPNTNEVN